MAVRARLSLGALVVAAVLGGAAVALEDGEATPRPRLGSRLALPSAPIRTRGQTAVVGRSVRGRPITALVVGDRRAPHPALVVGAIHGDETAGIAVAERLSAWHPPVGTALWIVRDLNPDGVEAGTRQNAHGVDLNRNFPFRWRPLGPRGSVQYAGPHPLSEPESRAAYRLIVWLRPRLTIWFHQPLGLTDRSGGDARLERRFARLSGLPERQLTRYPGSVSTWQNVQVGGGTAFVVELPAGRPPARAVARYARAVRLLSVQATLSRSFQPRGVP